MQCTKESVGEYAKLCVRTSPSFPVNLWKGAKVCSLGRKFLQSSYFLTRAFCFSVRGVGIRHLQFFEGSQRTRGFSNCHGGRFDSIVGSCVFSVRLRVVRYAVGLEVNEREVLYFYGAGQVVNGSRFLGRFSTIANGTTMYSGTYSVGVNDCLFGLLLCTIFFFMDVAREAKQVVFSDVCRRTDRVCYTLSSFDRYVISDRACTWLLTVLTRRFRFFVYVYDGLVRDCGRYLAREAGVASVLIRVTRSFFRSFRVQFFGTIRASAAVRFRSLYHDRSCDRA